MSYVKLGSPPAIGNVVRNTGEFSTVGVGAAAVTSALYVNATNRIGAWVTGANISTGSDADGIFVDASFQPSANVTNCASIGLYPTFAPPVGVTITTGYGLYVASGTQAGAGAVTTGYGLFVTHPTFGTTNYAAQIDNIRIDVNSIVATDVNGTMTLSSNGTGAINIGTNATAHTTTLGSTNSTSATTVQSGSGALAVTSTNGTLTINSGTGALGISTDASATTISIGTGGAVKGLTIGSVNSTSATTVQSGSGALNLTSTNGTMTFNSGTGAIAISNDATNTTVGLGTGAGVKAVTLGSTNTTSTTTVQAGASGTLSLNFPAESNLTHYKEATFTPVLNFGGATTGIAYTTQLGEYTKIGNVVFINITIVLSSKGSATGVATITGLPFSSVNTTGQIVSFNTIIPGLTVSTRTQTYSTLDAGTSTLALTAINIPTGALAQLADTTFAATSKIFIAGFYFTT